MLDIVGLCGSLRAGSFNRMALELAARSLPEGAAIEIVDYRDLPVFDADRMAQGLPEPVARLVDRIRRADGVVIASPEYNYSIPGNLKNALDWVSRAQPQPFAGKPVAILSATGGPLGGARMQYDLRKVLLFLDAMTMIKPEVFIGMAQTKFDAATRECTDEATRKFVGAQMGTFVAWIGRVRAMAAA